MPQNEENLHFTQSFQDDYEDQYATREESIHDHLEADPDYLADHPTKQKVAFDMALDAAIGLNKSTLELPHMALTLGMKAIR